jgi:hypothetical protein
VSDPRPPDNGPRWPERDLGARDPEDQPPPGDEGPTTEEGEATIGFAGAEGGWNPRLLGERRRPTTAEQAVPWLIGMVLALAGIVIVLLALIFTAPDELGVGLTSPSPSPSLVLEPTPEPTTTSTPEPTATPAPTPSATQAPSFGPLEMLYLGRATTLAPVTLYRRDFSTKAAAIDVAHAASGIQRYAWSPDGRVGAVLVAGRLVALSPGAETRTLAEGITAVTFGLDADTIYAVKVVRAGANDRADFLKIDFADGATDTLAFVSYPHPVIASEAPLKEAQFVDNGGIVRIYATADGNLVVWLLGAPSTYKVDVGDGTVTNIDAQPVLWSGDGQWRTALKESGGSTTIQLFDTAATLKASVTVTGLVSHIRWAGSSNEIVFTLGRAGANGGVRQDLFVWNLVDGKAPMPLTSNGVSFGAEWLGTSPHWVP